MWTRLDNWLQVSVNKMEGGGTGGGAYFHNFVLAFSCIYIEGVSIVVK